MANLTSSAAFPGPISAKMLDELSQFVIATPYPFVLDLAKCNGMTLVTVDGQELFDWTGYYGSKLLGHNHPEMFEPEYLRRLSVAANNKIANPDFLTPECLEYYRFLYRTAPKCLQGEGLEVYAVNSGAEAVENMMKYLVALFNEKSRKKGAMIGNRRFLYFDRAFHGRTVFALGVTQTMDPVATKDFQGLTSGGNLKLPFPSFNSDASHEENLANCNKALEQVEMVLRQMASEIVGIIVEPIQGAGGHRVAMEEFFIGLSRLCHQYDVYLGFDEVQTGGGATGKMWALDHYALPYPPAAVASGKKLGNGVLYMHEPLTDIGVLDSTWGGTLADMVRVVREFEIVERDGLIQRAAETGEYLAEQLRGLAKRTNGAISNVRGLGIYQGFSLGLPENKRTLTQFALQQHGLLLLGAGNRTIRLRPNLSVTKQDVDRLIELLEKCLSQM